MVPRSQKMEEPDGRAGGPGSPPPLVRPCSDSRPWYSALLGGGGRGKVMRVVSFVCFPSTPPLVQSPALPFLLPYRTHSLSFPLFFSSSPIISCLIYPDALFLNHFSLSLTFILPSSHHILSSFDILFPNHYSLSLTFIPPSSHYIPSYLDIFFANHFPLSLAHHSTSPNVVVIPARRRLI